jgi:hypothetical protein
MARPRKETNEASSATPATPAILRKKKYFSKFMTFRFSVRAVDKDGNAKIERNNQSQPIYDADGNEKPIYITIAFKNLSERASQGYLSMYEFDPSDESYQNSEIGKALESLALDPSVNVLDEDTYDRSTNSAMYAEKKRRQALEDEVQNLRAENEKIKSSPDELRKRLAELTGE